MKRLFDLFFSVLGLLFLLPALLIISIMVFCSDFGPIFYRQVRVGKDEQPFKLFKFRTMVTNADKAGKLTVGNRDPRITRVGYFLRKYKLDELPQLINILVGDMSFVGPRPEVPKYVDMYSEKQKKVLTVKPGLTDLASLKYINENEVLGKAENPEQLYIEKIMPEKLILNQEYIENQSLGYDLGIIFKTIKKIIVR